MIPRRLLFWIVLAVCVPMWDVIAGIQMYWVSDALRQHYPFQVILGRLLDGAPGRLPLWDPFLSCGHPLLGDPGFQAWYPPALVYRFLPFPVAFGVFLAIHLLLAATGMAAFILRLGFGVRAAGLAAVAFALGAHPSGLLAVPPVLCAYAWLPWVALAADSVAAGGGARAAAGLAVVLAWLALAGYPPCVVYAGVLAAVVMALKPGARPWVRPALAGVVVAAALAAALAIPFVGYLADTARGHPLAAAAADEGSMPLWGVFGFLLPHAFLPQTEDVVLGAPWLWTFLHYVGVIPLALAATALALRRSVRTGAAALRAPVWLVVIGLALALGRSLPGLGPVLGFIPPFSFLRHAGLWAALAGFGVAWLAAAGLDQVERSLRGADGRRIMAGWALAVVFLCSVWIGTKAWKLGKVGSFMVPTRLEAAQDFAARMGGVWYPAGVLGFGLVLLGLAARREVEVRPAAVALCALAWMDVLAIRTAIQPVGRAEWLMAQSPTEAFFSKAAPPGTWGRVLVTPRLDERPIDEGDGRRGLIENYRAAFRTNLPAVAGMRQAGTDNPLRPAGTEAYLESVLYYPTKPSDRNAVEVFDRLGVKWLVVPSRLAGPGLKLVHQGYVGVYERTGRAPRAAWTEPGDAGRVRHSISRFPGEWTLDVLVARPGLVVVSESFVRGWRLEGAPAGSRVVEAPGGLIGLALPAGNYPSVRLVYDPWTVKAGLGISLLALAGLFIFGLWRLERVRA